MMQCPVCRSSSLVEVEESQVHAASCPRCRGTFISGDALTTRAKREASPDQPPRALPPIAELAATAADSNTAGALGCPICGQAMRKGRFRPQIPVPIDVCVRCNYLWLDAGELGLILRLYQELVGARPAPLPGQQERLDRLRATQVVGQASIPQQDAGMAAAEIGMAVVGAVLEMLLFSGSGHHHHHHHGW